MTRVQGFLKRQTPRLVALAVIVALGLTARLPALSTSERSEMAARFEFARQPLPKAGGTGLVAGRREDGSVAGAGCRAVHPDLANHAGWISTVGAAVALNDLDGDGLPNDVVYIDVRTDQVIVAPVPGTGERYEPFTLDLALSRPTVAPMGCIPGDFNEDGRLDVLVYYWGRTPVVFLRRATDSRPAASEYAAIDLLPGGERWNTNAATRADVDGDGHVDLIVGNYFQDGARILDPEASSTEEMQDSMSRAVNGGVNRVLLWKEASAGTEPSVRFEDVPGVFDEDVARGWTLGLGAADLDGDQLPELYFANDFGSDRLLHNRSTAGAPRFEVLNGRKGLNTPGSKRLGRDSFKGMGVDFGDIDGDGRFDIYVSNIADEFALQESHFAWISTGPVSEMADGIAPYTDRSEPLGLSRSSWGWESRLADFDNDGVLEAIQATGFLKGVVDRWPELHELALGNDTLVHAAGSWPKFVPGDDLSGHAHNPFFVRSDSGRFFDLAVDLGLHEPHVTRGIATADIDGDGDLDFAIANQWEDSYCFHNDAGHGAFLGLNLRLPIAGPDGWSDAGPSLVVHPGHPDGSLASRAAIGAIARVSVGDREMVGLVDGGNGHSGARSHQVHFGLGARSPDAGPIAVGIDWRDGDGRVHHTDLDLEPGWHTILLAATERHGGEG